MPAMEQRISLITLGVADLRRAMDFYGALGWEGRSPDGDVAFYQAGGMVVGLWHRAKLAEDTAVEDGGGWGGITLAHNVRSEPDVDAVLAEVEAAGGRIVRAAGKTFWGGYSGVFLDPDGHAWEVAYGPNWKIAEDGSMSMA
jgi:catechol 2,3-dioxygenase-like lactoylglutathione lyase family enzyme